MPMKNIEFHNIELTQKLFDTHNTHLEKISKAFNLSLASRGNTLSLKGEDTDLTLAETLIHQLYELLREGFTLIRPAVDAGEALGFFPGDLAEKVNPYLRPLYDALYDCMPPEQVERRLASGEIEIAPIAFMRGRTLNDAFVILDEAQNTTHNQMKMFLTRMGKHAKFIINGDPGQIDLPRRTISGLKEALLILKDIEGVGMIFLDDKDVIRHKLVKKVIEAYKHIENRD